MKLPTRAEIAKTYDAISESFNRTREAPWPEVVGFADSLAPRSLVADLACGNGRHTAVLLDRGHLVVGIDASRRLLARARGRAPAAAFAVADLCALPVRDRAFGGALMVAAIHHLPTAEERLRAVRELARVLRPKARALITAWSVDRVGSGPVEATGPDSADVWVPWGADGQGLKRFYHLFRDNELSELILRAGLRVERYFKSRDNHIAVAERDG